MTINPQAYTHKGPDIEVVPVTSETLVEVGAWLTTELGESYTVTVHTHMGGSIYFGPTGGEMRRVHPGLFLARDGDGKIFVLDTLLLDAFYNAVV